MPAAKLNYLVIYKNDSQVYGTGNKEIALTSPLPEGAELEDKRILFIANEPDTGNICVYPLPQEEVMNADIKPPKEKTILKTLKEEDVQED